MPSGEALILLGGDFLSELGGGGEAGWVDGDGGVFLVSEVEGLALGEESFWGGFFVPFDFAVDDVEFGVFLGDV